MTHDKRDFESAVDANYPALVRAATVLCCSGADVEEVVQETVLRAFESYGSFKGRSSFLTWCYVILTRVAAAANRQRRRKIPAEYATLRAVHAPPVDGAVVDADEARGVMDAIRSLPQRQREMVTLHFLEDLSYAEIAEALGVAVGTVKATIFAAKTSLRSALTANGLNPR